jgi:dihydrofolate synthase/folylpolyglutamate synthase
LGDFLQKKNTTGKTRAVFSMLADKDIVSTLAFIKKYIDVWYVAPLNTERAASKEMLAAIFQQAEIENLHWYDSIKKAHEIALNEANDSDRVVVFGSFHTVAEVKLP